MIPGLDRHSATWTAIESWAQEQLREVRESNDSTKLNEAQTNALRGEIRALKRLIALPDPPKERKRPPPEED